MSRSAGSVQQWLIVNQPGAFGSNYGLHSHTRQWALPQAVLKCNQHFFSNWCKMRPLTFLCGKACAKFDHNVYVWVWLDMINIVEFEVEQVLDMNVKTSQRGGYLVAAISVEKSKKCCLGSCTPTTITTTHPTACKFITANQKSEHTCSDMHWGIWSYSYIVCLSHWILWIVRENGDDATIIKNYAKSAKLSPFRASVSHLRADRGTGIGWKQKDDGSSKCRCCSLRMRRSKMTLKI